MIYTCENCSAWFSGELLRAAMARNETLITCPYCGRTTQFRDMQQSRIAKAYDFLSIGEFGAAKNLFLSSIRECESNNRTPSPDAYLGCALCDFSVRTVFSESDPNKLTPPQFIFYRSCDDETVFSQSASYRAALRNKAEGDPAALEEESARIRGYGETIDAVFRYYHEIATERNNANYEVFIAYEDEPIDGAANQGYKVATKVYNDLPDSIEDVFLPDIENYDNNKLRYEAAILYAIEHSNCMLVIADNDIDMRLTGTYLRYFYSHDFKGKQLGFVRYLDKIPIALSDHEVAKNIFDIDKGKDGYCRFVCENNKKIYYGGGEEESHTDDGYTNTDPEEDEERESATDSDRNGENIYKPLPNGQFKFGYYPQRKEDNPEVLAHFDSYEKPSPLDSKDWQPMFYSKKTGRPYTWFRDEDFNGKRYRAIYFTRFREPFSVQPSDVPAKEQKVNGYMPQNLYVFAFSPIVWNSIEQSVHRATLCANQALDSRPFNDSAMAGGWDFSSIRAWLNNDFLYTAFDDNQRAALFTIGEGDDKVFLVDFEIDRQLFKKRGRSVLGSDYYKCIGGMCREYGVQNYWVLADFDSGTDERAAVVFPVPDKPPEVSAMSVDSTSVAVLPKVILTL